MRKNHFDKAEINAFVQLKTSSSITFVLYPFHSHFDGLIELIVLTNMKLLLDLTNKISSNNFAEILIFHELDSTKFTILIISSESAGIKVPVTHKSDEVVISEMEIDGLYFSETPTKPKYKIKVIPQLQ